MLGCAVCDVKYSAVDRAEEIFINETENVGDESHEKGDVGAENEGEDYASARYVWVALRNSSIPDQLVAGLCMLPFSHDDVILQALASLVELRTEHAAMSAWMSARIELIHVLESED